MSCKIAVVGSGAIGSSVGADLTKAGCDVVLIDQWPAHVEAMKANGLRVVMTDGEIHTPVRAYHLCDVHTLNERFDIVLLAAKSYDTRWMLELVKPYLAPGGFVVGMQNGMNDEAIVSVVGYGRTLGCVLELSAEVFTPGVVQRNTNHKSTWLGFGELHGRLTPRLTELEAMMRNVARVSVTTNIWGAKWTKLVNSSMILSVFGMLGMQSWEATETPEVFKLSIRVGRETMAVGAALGYTMEPIFGFTAEELMGSTDEIVEKLLRAVLGHLGPSARNTRGVVLQDYAKGRYSEVDYLTGVVVQKGLEAGIPTPANAAVAHVNQQIRAGALKPERANLKIVQEMLA
jgi:2-dehydropantoate 2-reductase